VAVGSKNKIKLEKHYLNKIIFKHQNTMSKQYPNIISKNIVKQNTNKVLKSRKLFRSFFTSLTIFSQYLHQLGGDSTFVL
jgi:hypothetical protein